jgi:FlaG/FlaF family flagellin (archaellin)
MLKKFKNIPLFQGLGLTISLLKSKRGVSPVITLIILTAIGVVIAIAVMLWASGLTGSFMSREDIRPELYELYPEGDSFVIRVRLKNLGNVPSQISSVTINDTPMSAIEGAGLHWVSEQGESGDEVPIPLRIGVSVDVKLTIPNGASYDGGILTSGTTISLGFRSSSSSNDYKVTVRLP